MNTLKKSLALLLCAAMTIPAFACGEKIDPAESENSTVQTDAEGNTVAENSAAEGDASENSDENSNANGNSVGGNASEDLDKDVVVDEHGQQNHALVFQQPENLEEEPVVSTKRGADGTVYVAKTDINGATVTEANGEAQTEVYTGVTNAASYSEPEYEPLTKTYQAFWLDISEQSDFVFDGNLLEFEVKVADDAPDGVYPVEVYFADFSNYSANSDENAAHLKDVAFRAGYLCINSEEPEAEALGSKLTLTPDTISAKPGDTVRMNVRIDNNTGIVAFVIRLHYDEKVMTILEAAAGDALGELATLTTNTLDD